MARITRGKTSHARHKKVLDAASGYRTLRHTNIRRAREAVMHALAYQYRDRRNKKRDFRALWINRINAALTGMGLKYSPFIKAMSDKKVELDRKIMAQLAVQQPEIFERVAKEVAAK